MQCSLDSYNQFRIGLIKSGEVDLGLLRYSNQLQSGTPPAKKKIKAGPCIIVHVLESYNANVGFFAKYQVLVNETESFVILLTRTGAVNAHVIQFEHGRMLCLALGARVFVI